VSSNINYLGINENFPVAGQDNDTQTFRDNFDTIKNSLREAKDEITDLQDNTAKTDEDNDFNLKIIQNALFQYNRTQKFDYGSVTVDTTVDFQNGNYQIFYVGNNINMDFLNFPGDVAAYPDETTPIGMGKVTLELHGDGTARVITFITSGGTVIKKDPSFPGALTVESINDPVFVEVWRHSADVIFMRYLGQYS